MTKNPNWPYDAIFKQPGDGVKLQFITTYQVKNGKLHKETVTRRFMGDNDYQDSVTTEVICDVT